LCIRRSFRLPAGFTALVQQLLRSVVAITPLPFTKLLHLSAQSLLLLRLRGSPSCVLIKLPARTARIAIVAALTKRIGRRAVFITATGKLAVSQISVVSIANPALKTSFAGIRHSSAELILSSAQIASTARRRAGDSASTRPLRTPLTVAYPKFVTQCLLPTT
jgi:hypothetical protein